MLDEIKTESPMTKEQMEAYNSFIDYMVKLYNEFGYLLEEAESVG